MERAAGHLKSHVGITQKFCANRTGSPSECVGHVTTGHGLEEGRGEEL